jgi:DNA-binding NarL/FixJ family response regulator
MAIALSKINRLGSALLVSSQSFSQNLGQRRRKDSEKDEKATKDEEPMEESGKVVRFKLANYNSHVQNSDPDLVFLDVRLPGQSGLELTKMIKKLHPDIEVIIVSMFGMAEYREAAFRSGAGHFFATGSARCNKIAAAVAADLASRGEECRVQTRR